MKKKNKLYYIAVKYELPSFEQSQSDSTDKDPKQDLDNSRLPSFL